VNLSVANIWVGFTGSILQAAATVAHDYGNTACMRDFRSRGMVRESQSGPQSLLRQGFHATTHMWSVFCFRKLKILYAQTRTNRDETFKIRRLCGWWNISMWHFRSFACRDKKSSFRQPSTISTIRCHWKLLRRKYEGSNKRNDRGALLSEIINFLLRVLEILHIVMEILHESIGDPPYTMDFVSAHKQIN